MRICDTKKKKMKYQDSSKRILYIVDDKQHFSPHAPLTGIAHSLNLYKYVNVSTTKN